MSDIRIKNVKSQYTLILRKMSGIKVGFIPYNIITNLSRGIKTVSELDFTVSKYIGADNTYNPLYDELQIGRYIDLDQEETFVIYDVSTSNNNIKTVKAYGKEKKLSKNKIELSDITLTLKNPYEDIKDCYSLDELLYEDTGWHIDYVSDTVLYNSDATIMDVLNGNNVNLMTTEKLRYQESIATNWYDYINNDIAEQFECYPIFDSYNKKVHLYSDEELGENTSLLLSYDNYLKSHEVSTSIEDITTRLTLRGNDDLTILEENPTGETYIEDFTYFMEQEEMTPELIRALELYNERVKVLTQRWYNLREQKAQKEETLQNKKVRLTQIYKKIQALKSVISSSADEEFNAQKTEEIADLTDEQIPLEAEIETLTAEIKDLDTEILEVNMSCKKRYATTDDTNNTFIFTEALLNELKEFVFHDDYSNDCITDALTLYRLGLYQIKRMGVPTKTWSIDTVNFVNSLIDNEFRQQWKGELALGDKIVIQDDEGIVDIAYFIGYSQSFKNGEESIQLELSNMKENNNFSLTIGERLTVAQEAYKMVKTNQSAVNALKRNRIGLNYDKINKEVL